MNNTKRLPEWLKIKSSKHKEQQKIRDIIKNNNIHTVCESAKCPNRGECFSNKTVTFMILGDHCTRNCAFCAISHETPQAVDQNEDKHILNAARTLNIEYIVITSVTRDDLPDGGASQFKKVVNTLKKNEPQKKVEILTPDFQGNTEAIYSILEENPDVFNHNIETIKRLYPKIRNSADFDQSLMLLKYAKKNFPHIKTKTGMMLGVGETSEEIKETLKTIANNQIDIVTLGQYIRPSKQNIEVKEYIHPDIFLMYKEYGEKLGLKMVSEPLARSSYHAAQVCNDV